MRFTSTLILAFSALASLVSAQSTTSSKAPPTSTGISVIGNPNPISYPLGGTLKAGTLTTITWTPTSGGSVSLILREGKENNLSNIGTIAADIPNTGSFSWAIPKDMVAGSDYTIQIVSGKDSNYSPLFGIDSTVTSSSASSTKSQTSTSRSSSSTSASSTSASSTSASSTSASSTTVSSRTSSATPSTTVSTTASTTVASSNSSSTFHTSTKSTAPANATNTDPAATASNINSGTNLVSSLPFIFCIIAGFIYLN